MKLHVHVLSQPQSLFRRKVLQVNPRLIGWSSLLQEAELRLVSFLPELLALQKTLVKRFQNVSETEYRTIRGFISSHTSGKTLLS